MATPDHHALERMLWPNGRARDIWMIVDAARDRRIFGMLLDCFYSDRTCLFSGPLAPELEIAAPYLIRLEHEDTKAQRFVGQAWTNDWALFFKSGQGRDELRRHLSELLVVLHPNGSSMLFRYYDPRVLRRYLPTCNADELKTVFGGIECFWLKDDESGMAVNLSFDQKQLVSRSVSPGG